MRKLALVSLVGFLATAAGCGEDDKRPPRDAAAERRDTGDAISTDGTDATDAVRLDTTPADTVRLDTADTATPVDTRDSASLDAVPDLRDAAVVDAPVPVDTADAGVDSADVAIDTPTTDAGTDLGTDRGTDAGTDGGTDAGSDAGTDSGSDAGTDSGSDAGTDSGTDAGTDVGGTPAAKLINGCTSEASYVDRSGTGSRLLVWDLNIGANLARCMKVKVGEQVTWSGDFAAHPIAPLGGDLPTMIPAKTSGTVNVAIFTTPGTYGYYCTNHPATMLGAIYVVP